MVIRALLTAVLILASRAVFADGGKEEYEKAVKYSKAGEYEAALPLFKKAYELSGKRPSTIIALAQCERSLKIWNDAIGHFKEYLAVKPTPKDAKKIQETIALLEEIRAQQPPPVKTAVAAAETTPKIESPPRVAQTQPQPKPQTPKQQPPPQEPQRRDLIATAPIAGERDDETVLESPLFWIISGAVVLAAGGVAATVALSGEDDPYGGTSGQVLRK